MRIAHFDCFSGISGDMTLAALISSGVPVHVLQEGLASLNLPIELEVEEVLRGCFSATYVRVKVPNGHPQRFLKEIQSIINEGKLSQGARELALTIFHKLGEAEATAHGMSIDQVHFHEVGALDSIADIVGSAIGLDYLQLDHVTARSVPTGHGTVKAAHGLMPVPTPATATLLKGVPLAPSFINGELTTPTGAAILSSIVKEWRESPLMTIESVGYGAGTKDFAEQPNVLRLFLGHDATQDSNSSILQDEVWMLETNVDDVAGEIIGYCMEKLLQAGALDVFTIPIQMKKQRPGVMVCVITNDIKVSHMETILFQELRTLGVRRTKYHRHKLARQERTIQTPWGDLLAKEIVLANGEKLLTPEFEVCAQIARSHQIPLWKVYESMKSEQIK